mgnify:CR=1 FL=1
MKLIIENFKKFLKDDEFSYNHNLFIDFIKNDLSDEDHQKYVEYFRNYAGGSIDQKANQMMHRIFKWRFPYDVASGDDCSEKLQYLDALVKSFYQNPNPMDTLSEPPTPEIKESSSATTPYTKCKKELSADREAEKKTRDDMSKL